MNAVLGRIASTSEELAHYHSGDGNILFSYSSLLSLSSTIFRKFIFFFANCVYMWSSSDNLKFIAYILLEALLFNYVS
jgi:hypothetical protein